MLSPQLPNGRTKAQRSLPKLSFEEQTIEPEGPAFLLYLFLNYSLAASFCPSSGLLQDLPKATGVVQGLHRPPTPSRIIQHPAPGGGDKTKGKVPSPNPMTNTPWPWGRRDKARLEQPSQVEGVPAHGREVELDG